MPRTPAAEEWLHQSPPWVVFPHLEAADPAARQGAEELWIDEVWRPFWAALSAEQREDYLRHWRADDTWRVALHASFESATPFDASADAAESQAWLQAHGPATATRGGGHWLTRWLRWLGGRRS